MRKEPDSLNNRAKKKTIDSINNNTSKKTELDSINNRVLFYIAFCSLLVALFISMIILLLFNIGFVEINETDERISLFVFILFLVSAISGSAIGIIISVIALKPIRQITEATIDVSQGDYSHTLPELSFKNASSELKLLVKNFNIMVKKLSEMETISADFISYISHEFKTPLATIKGYAKLLADDGITKEDKDYYLDVIETSINNLTSLVQNILKISKLEGSNPKLDLKKISLDEQVRDAIIMLEGAWQKKNIDVDYKCDENIIITTDENLLLQVWINIIGNAIKYSDKYSDIIVEVRDKGALCEVKVRDYGQGMSEETISHIFEKFYQGDTSHSKEGNGLGMCLVNSVISILGGKIFIESKVGEGTIVTVRLPHIN